MAVTVVHTPEIDESKFSLPIDKGGTSARSPKKAAKNLGLVSYDQVDQKDGIALLSDENSVQPKNYPASLTDSSIPVFFGDSAFYVGDSMVVQIVNYDSTATYVLDNADMAATDYVFTTDQIVLSSKANATGAQILRINGREFHYEIKFKKPMRPTLENLAGSLLSDRIVLDATVPFEAQAFTSSNFFDQSGLLVHGYTEWEISTAFDFSSTYKTESTAGSKITWNAVNFTPDTTQYLRFRHVSTNNVKSDWSQTYQFRTAVMRAILKPAITSPIDQATGVAAQPVFSSTAFNAVNFTGVHLATDWQVATDAAFTNLVQTSMSDGVNLTSWQPPALTYNAMYYVRVRHRADTEASNGSPYSEWSDAVTFTVTVDNRSVVTPMVSVVGGNISVSKTAPVFNGNAFSSVNYSDTHYSSDWQIAEDVNFSTVIASSIGDQVNKTSWSPVTNLQDDKVYYVRVSYNGTVKKSEWSTAVNFATSAIFEMTTVGAGAGGSSGFTATTAYGPEYASGAGGGGGGVSRRIYELLPDTLYTAVVGGGGLGGVQIGGSYLNSAGGLGQDSYITIGGTELLRAGGGSPGQSLDGGSSRNHGGVGGAGTVAPGGKGGNGGSVVAYSGFYLAAEPGSGLNGGLIGGEGNPVGGGGGSPSVPVPGFVFQGGQGGLATSGSMNGGIGSGGGGARWDSGQGGNGGNGAVMVEYPSTRPLLETTGATYALVNGRHRYIWTTPGTFTFKLAAFFADIVISTTAYNYNLKNDLIARGWDQVIPVEATVTVQAGVVVGASNISTYAFNRGSGYPTGSKLKLINRGYVIGKGGDGEAAIMSPNRGTHVWHGGGSAGGPALSGGYPITIENYGVIGGGGGGAGAGMSAALTGDQGGIYYEPGGAGGGGAGYYPGAGGAAGLDSGYYNGGMAGNPGSTLSGGTGGNGTGSGLYGGTGGNLGQPGANGNGTTGYNPIPGDPARFLATDGHPAGAAITGNASITWAVTGSILGPVI